MDNQAAPKLSVYAFIDSQNLNLGVLDLGWKLDFKRFYVYLRDKYKVTKALLFLGYMKKHEAMYKRLRENGYEIVFKPTVGNKGNVDTELVLTAAMKLNEFDKAVVVTGDGDFYCLLKLLQEKKKLARLLVPNRSKFSCLLLKFRGQTDFVDYLQSKLELVNKIRGGALKTKL